MGQDKNAEAQIPENHGIDRDVVAVQAEGNYVSLQHQPNPYLVHESLSSMAEKLKPYVLFASTARSS